jgi:hypothetical protein
MLNPKLEHINKVRQNYNLTVKIKITVKLQIWLSTKLKVSAFLIPYYSCNKR